MIEHVDWPKTPRLYREVTITEKIDGTNAAVVIQRYSHKDLYRGVTESGGVAWVGDSLDEDAADGSTGYLVGAQSRNRLIFPGQDNAGFAHWVKVNAGYLVDTLGEGRHFGEWWGKGIQRGYGQEGKVFSLFNTRRFLGVESWAASDGAVFELESLRTVPVLYQGRLNTYTVDDTLETLWFNGSAAAPGFDRPEGICIYHRDADRVFKVMIENDDTPKGAQ